MTDEAQPDWEAWRDAIIGLGEHSARKSFYPELQKRVEELRHSHASLRELIDSVYDAIVLHDYSGNILEVNDSMLNMFGLERHQLPHVNILQLQPNHLAFPEADIYWQRVRAGDQHVIFEWKAQKQSGESFDVEIALRSLCWHGIDLIIGVIRDISDRKAAENERVRLTQELKRHKSELERMLFVFGHDMRSPVVNLQGFAGELERSLQEMRTCLAEKSVDRLEEIVATEIPAIMHYISQATEKLAAQIDGMIRVGRMGQAVLRIVDIDCQTMITSVLDSANWQLREIAATAEVGPLPNCSGDLQWLGQVFTNLIDNAIKYRHRDRPLQLRITGDCDSSHSYYHIADNGIGMSEPETQKVWELFYRGKKNMDAIPGDGLGLTMVRAILERQGGTIAVESVLDQGTTFHIGLPTADNSPGLGRD